MAVLYWTLRALLSHWRRHPVQFFSVLTGLWLATALLTGVQALNSQARDSYARASQLIGGEPQASLSMPDGASFPQALFAQLRRAGWPVSPVVQGRVLLKGHEDRRLELMGIDPVSLPVVKTDRLDMSKAIKSPCKAGGGILSARKKYERRGMHGRRACYSALRMTAPVNK